MDDGQERTDGNAGEAEERRWQEATHNPQASGTNAPMDIFAQMMTAVTQLIQNAQSGSGGGDTSGAGGGGSVVMDKQLKLFQDMRPPLFSGSGGPIEAENWLLRVEKILEGLLCPVERRVTLATFTFEGEAERWWQGQVQEKFGGRPSSMIRWEDFVKVFRDWFVPLSARRQMQDKFSRLVQGDRSVDQYEAEFTTLSRYAPHMIPTAEEKCHRFLSGLKDVIRQPLIPFMLDDYSTLVERARRLEIDMQATQKRKDFQKRKSYEESRSVEIPQSGSSMWKKSKSGSSGGGSNINVSQCVRCGKLHRGECLLGSNNCYLCHRPGHIARYCPTVGQKTFGEQKSSGMSSARMAEPTVPIPSQNQPRQKIQPRVYTLTPQEPEEPGNAKD